MGCSRLQKPWIFSTTKPDSFIDQYLLRLYLFSITLSDSFSSQYVYVDIMFFLIFMLYCLVYLIALLCCYLADVCYPFFIFLILCSNSLCIAVGRAES